MRDHGVHEFDAGPWPGKELGADDNKVRLGRRDPGQQVRRNRGGCLYARLRPSASANKLLLITSRPTTKIRSADSKSREVTFNICFGMTDSVAARGISTGRERKVVLWLR